MQRKIKNSQLAIYQTSNDLSERTSVLWLENLFSRKGVIADFEKNDKKPDTDGSFTILDDGRFNGRLEVQIKTYNSKSSKSKAKYLCRTKVLYYALKNRISCVILYVVNTADNKAYWKYLSENFVQSLNLKETQKSVSISFDEFEYVNNTNFDDCLKLWHSYYYVKNNGIFLNVDNAEEVLGKREKVTEFLASSDMLMIDEKYIVCIQKFIDKFNYSFDYEYNTLKRFYYPNVWKFGIAIGEFTDKSLSYLIYTIMQGNNDLILKKININSVLDLDFRKNHLYAASNAKKNDIWTGESDIVMKYVNDKIKDLIENKRFLYLSPEIAIECIFDTLEQEYNRLRINYNDSTNLLSLKELFKNKYPNQIRDRELQTYSVRNKSNNVTIAYSCIEYLLNNGFHDIDRLYPVEPSYKNKDAYINYLCVKTEVVFSHLPALFEAYMYYAFPTLQSKITFWDDTDLISVVLLTDGVDSRIELNYFRSRNKIRLSPQLLFVRDFKHELYSGYFREVEENKEMDIFDYDFIFNGNSYKLTCRKFEDMRCIKNYFSIHKQLYRFLGEKFDKYLKPDCRIMSDRTRWEI